MQVSKTLMSGSERRSLELVAQAQNLLNHTNFAAVNNNFPWNPNYPLPGGGTLQNGPYRVSGFAPKSVVQLSQPLAFTAAYQARRVSLALRISF